MRMLAETLFIIVKTTQMFFNREWTVDCDIFILLNITWHNKESTFDTHNVGESYFFFLGRAVV
jgi:hypothetical protein